MTKLYWRLILILFLLPYLFMLPIRVYSSPPPTIEIVESLYFGRFTVLGPGSISIANMGGMFNITGQIYRIHDANAPETYPHRGVIKIKFNGDGVDGYNYQVTSPSVPENCVNNINSGIVELDIEPKSVSGGTSPEHSKKWNNLYFGGTLTFKSVPPPGNYKCYYRVDLHYP